MSKDDTGPAGFAKIARGLSDLFDFLAELDDSKLPRRGRHEKGGMVVEYSFGKRTLGEDASEGAGAPSPEPRSATPRRRARPTGLEVLEPVTDVFDEPDEVVLLFELPGVSRKDIHSVLDGDIFLVEARTGERLYRKEVFIDAKLGEQPPHLHLRNGILEVRLAKQK